MKLKNKANTLHDTNPGCRTVNQPNHSSHGCSSAPLASKYHYFFGKEETLSHYYSHLGSYGHCMSFSIVNDKNFIAGCERPAPPPTLLAPQHGELTRDGIPWTRGGCQGFLMDWAPPTHNCFYYSISWDCAKTFSNCTKNFPTINEGETKKSYNIHDFSK